ncbi:MAG: dipicolinate synthase subunit B, partial [Clostridia bacterium]|nr:dipicolinate synthase subunit B [Clostridia bacterium]
MIGYAFCGSFCTFDRSISVLKQLVHDYDVLPIMSYNAASTDTRFGKSADFIKKITDVCRRDPVLTIKDAEPLGPARPLDALVIAPCTGNTLAKL